MSQKAISIIQRVRRCYFCGTTNNLHLHHIFFGWANRKVSDENGFVVWLCAKHHNMSSFSVHHDKELDLQLKRDCQAQYEREHTREEFVSLIGKNYLD